MSLTRRSLLAGLSLVAAYASESGGPHLPAFASRQQLVIATGSTLGVYYRYGQALAGLLRGQGVDVSVLPTSASVENIDLLARGRVQLGFTAIDAAVDAASGRPPFAAVTPVLALARLYDDYIHLVVPWQSPVDNVAGLRGRRVSLGPANSGTALIAARILAAAGLGTQDVQASSLDLNGSTAALAQGRLDAFFWSGGLPTSGIVTLANTMQIRLVPMRDEAAALRGKYGSYYRAGTIPAATYPNLGDVDTIAIADLLATTPDMDTELAMRITRALFAGRGQVAAELPSIGNRLDERTAIFTEPIPLHPGALQYYREAKSTM